MSIKMIEAEDKHASKRTQILTESLTKSNEPGWGYFGMAGSLAIGDNSFAPRMVRAPASDDDGGEPIRNIQTNPTLKGNTPAVYFKFEQPLGLGDPYQDPSTMNKKGKVQMLDPDAAFKPPGVVKVSANKLGYEYIPHKDSNRDPIAMKEKYGGDYMPPRQIYGAPLKKGGGGVYTKGVLFGFGEDQPFPEAVADDYDAAKKARKKELEEHHSKIQEVPFKGMAYGNDLFQPNSEALHSEIPTNVPRDPVPEKTKPYPHEMAFRPGNPSKKGLVHGLMGGVPEWIAEPAPGPTGRKPASSEEAPPGFKIGAPKLPCNPTPSVTCMARNMRNERPASFMRPSLR
jgi:hypothetical protein